MLNISHIVTILLVLTQTCAVKDRCTYINYRGKDVGNRGRGRSQGNETASCTTQGICRKNFQISVIDTPPYSTSRIFEGILGQCCGECLNVTYTKTYTNVTEIELSSVATSADFILPFLARSSAVELYSFHFILFIDVPCAYYITHKHESTFVAILSAVFSLYPLIVVSILAAMISGFIIWSLETRYNKEHFPSSFCVGVFEGFWWSFISMTTVGYGDTLVRSVPAKIYSVIWILIGIILFTFLTSLFTAELMIAMQPHHDMMTSRNVGVLKYRDYDATLVVAEGGVVNETDGWNFYTDVLTLLRMLRKKEIDGFLIDKYTLAYTIEYLKWKKHNLDPHCSRNQSEGEPYSARAEDIEYFFNNTQRTLKSYKEEKLAYGVLVSDSRDYEYFNNAARDNRFSLEASIGSEMNQLFPHAVADKTNGYFYSALKCTGCAIGVILVIGVLYELYKTKNKSIISSLDDEKYEKGLLKDKGEELSGQKEQGIFYECYCCVLARAAKIFPGLSSEFK